MNTPSASTPVRRALTLLAAQAFALGLTVAWVAIPASAIFLDAYGAGALPYTYIGAAIAGAAASALLSRSFRGHTLVWVTTRVLAGFAAAMIVAAALAMSGPWVSVVLLVLVPIMVPVGFMFVVGQAGVLLDVRVLKASYPKVIAGFALGLVAGGLAGPFLLDAMGRTEGLLALAAAVAVAFFVLAEVTARGYPTQFAAAESSAAEGTRPTLRTLARNRFVVLIMAFQMLSAIESQWLDFLVYDRAAQRYASSEALASFISMFTAIAYGTDIVFLLVVAGLLLRRYGLRYGLTANAAVVLVLVVATIASSAVHGAGSTIAFVLVGASRVSDLTLSDGATRASLGAAYQAVSTRDRLAAQAAVEGLAVPVAIGASGLAIIAVRATVGTSGIALPVMTTVVVLCWIAVAARVYGDYRTNLLTNLRQRVLDPAELPIDEPNTLAAIDRLLDSTDERDVRLGLQTLDAAGHPELADRLARLALDHRATLRLFALERLLVLDPDVAAASARLGLGDADPAARAASLRVLARCGTSADTESFTAAWYDDDDEVRVAAAAGLARLGDESVRTRVSADLGALAGSAESRDPLLVARVLAACEPGDGIARNVLADLLRHPDPEVAVAGLDAVQWPADGHLVVEVALLVEHRRTGPAACEALGRGGASVLGCTDDGLAGRFGLSPRARSSLVRVCRSIASDDAADVLGRHVADRDRLVGISVAHALARIGSGDTEIDGLVRTEIEHAAHTARVLASLEEVPGTDVLCWALRDEAALIARRLGAVLTIRYGTDGVSHAVQEAMGNDPRASAMAMEWLDVTLVEDDRALLVLVEREWSAARRARALERWVTMADADLPGVLSELIHDPADRWRRPWISACAIRTAHLAELDHLIPWELAHAEVPHTDEASIVPETIRAIAARRADLRTG